MGLRRRLGSVNSGSAQRGQVTPLEVILEGLREPQKGPEQAVAFLSTRLSRLRWWQCVEHLQEAELRGRGQFSGPYRH